MNLGINQAPPIKMHIDLNSCFAICEQQANPLLRGRAVAVAAYNSPGGCVLAASYEAKACGVKTGHRVYEAKKLCPEIIIKEPDPPMYRYVSGKILEVFRRHCPSCTQKSVDEAVLDFSSLKKLDYKNESGRWDYLSDYFSTSTSSLLKSDLGNQAIRDCLFKIAGEIKKDIRQEIGDWLTVNIGLGPNRFLAKLASNWHKPDGLDEISSFNLSSALCEFGLKDLCGINFRFEERLNLVDIFTPQEILDASLIQLRQAFGGVGGYYWYLRIRGHEIDEQDFSRKSFGQSYALPKATKDETELCRILAKLCEKMGRRLREAGYYAHGIHVGCLFKNGKHWHHGEKVAQSLFSTRSLYRQARRVLFSTRLLPVTKLSVSCFSLQETRPVQQSLFKDFKKEQQLTEALDDINDRFGEFTVSSARMLGMDDKVLDRITFGK